MWSKGDLPVLSENWRVKKGVCEQISLGLCLTRKILWELLHKLILLLLLLLNKVISELIQAWNSDEVVEALSASEHLTML